MKYLNILVAAFFIFGATAILAGDSAAMCGSCGTDTKDQAKDYQTKQAQGKHIEVDSNEEGARDSEQGITRNREMPVDETFDENTGMPDVVPSDRAGELQ